MPRLRAPGVCITFLLSTLFLIAFVQATGPLTAAGEPSPSEGRASGVSPAALGPLLERVKASGSDAFVVVRNGEPVLTWRRDADAGPMECMSITKSVVSLAIGRLIDTGRIRSVDEPVSRFFPEWSRGKKRLVTLRLLLNHTSGLKDMTKPGSGIGPKADFVRAARDGDLISDPGTEFSYNNSAVNLLSGVVRKVTGKRLDHFVRDEIFIPLGIREYSWTVDGGGNALGMAGLHITAEDLARIGQLMVQGGVWKGRRIVSEEWIKLSTSPAQGFNPDSGLLWWVVRGVPGGFCARGHGGQYLVIIPESGLVAVRLVRQSAKGTDMPGFPGMVQELARDGSQR